MSDKNWYLKKQAEFVTASANFAAKLVAEGDDLDVSPEQSAAYGALNTALQSAYTAATTPETRTSVAIEQKTIAMANVRRAAIGLAKLIVSNPAVSDAQLISLGLLPRTTPTPQPATMTAPVVDAVNVVGRLVTARIHQADGSRARPKGTVGALVYSYVGNEIPTDPNAWVQQGLATRGKTEILFPDSVPNGATAFISALWLGRRGERGFASTPIQITIQGGPVVAVG
jgi:hypothetical protein